MAQLGTWVATHARSYSVATPSYASRARSVAMRVSVAPDGVCRFCSFGEGSIESETDEPLAQTENYFVVPSIGALVPGWLLICTREHRTNFAGKYGDYELVALRLRMARALSQKFRLPVRMFEHGAISAGSRTGCGVDHAHLHLLAIDADLLDARYCSDEGAIKWEDVTASSIDDRKTATEYLFYSADASTADPCGRVAFPARPTSQFFRRAVASAVGRSSEYDYRTHPHRMNALATLTALRAT